MSKAGQRRHNTRRREQSAAYYSGSGKIRERQFRDEEAITMGLFYENAIMMDRCTNPLIEKYSLQRSFSSSSVVTSGALHVRHLSQPVSFSFFVDPFIKNDFESATILEWFW